MIFIARKYKQVHRKELTFDLKDWEKIERRAEACHTDTTKYLRNLVLETQPTFYDFSELTPMVNGMRIISGNINQIAKKVNATNNIYVEDVIPVFMLFFKARQKHKRNTFIIRMSIRDKQFQIHYVRFFAS